MRGTLKIQDVVKKFKGVLTIDWLTSAMAMWNATVIPPEPIPAFAEMTVEREGEEIFDGVILEPTIDYGLGGTTRPLRGYDHTIKLLDYLCSYQSLVEVSTSVALAAILSNWPYEIESSDDFEYLGDPFVYDTSLEFSLDIETYVDTCVEYETTLELQDEFEVGTISDFGYAGTFNCFHYDGVTKRFYIFTREGQDIYYYHSPDGTTWTKVDSAVNSNSFNWGVAWHDGKVYLFVFDGANTDFHRGTINDGTGAITFALIAGNIFAGSINYGPVWDDQGDMWIVDNAARGNVYESVNDGVAWNLRFTGAANHKIWGLLAVGVDGDMMTFVEDQNNNDMEEWHWDRSAGTHTFVRKIADIVGAIDGLAGANNDSWNQWIAWTDGATGMLAFFTGAGWTVDNQGAMTAREMNLSCDGAQCAYLWINLDTGTAFKKYRNGVLVSTTTDPTWPWSGVGSKLGGPRGWHEEGQEGVFGCGRDAGNDGWFFITDPTGIRLNRGDATGSFRTNTITATGAMVNWGWVTAQGVQLDDDILWSILRAGDNSVLVDEQIVSFDMNAAGVSPLELTIKILCELTDTGTDPYVYEFDYSEYVQTVTIDTDITEHTYIGVEKLAALTGAEFWVTKDNGTFTLRFHPRRGEDKSNLITLKNAHSSRRPEVRPNIKLVSKTTDWESFANCITIVGAGTAGVNRIEETIKDFDSIDTYGEKWYSEPNLDIITSAMAKTRASVVLAARNVIIKRIKASIYDTYEPNDISIGDSAWFCIDFADVEEEEINEPLRMIGLTKMYSPQGGEKTEITMVNVIKATEYWEYLGALQDVARWQVI